MVTDLVKRLEGVTEDDAYAQPWTFGVTCREAAARIEALEHEAENLNAAWTAQCDRIEALEASLAAMTGDRDKWAAESAENLRSLAAMTANAKALANALQEGRRAIGEHHAPDDCYATGPMTGDAYRDLVECPACSFVARHDEALAAHAKLMEGK